MLMFLKVRSLANCLLGYAAYSTKMRANCTSECWEGRCEVSPVSRRRTPARRKENIHDQKRADCADAQPAGRVLRHLWLLSSPTRPIGRGRSGRTDNGAAAWGKSSQ